MADQVVIKPMFTLLMARVLAGMSTKEVAKELGVSARTLLNYEDGITSPRMEIVDKMIELYGIPLDNLIYDIKHFDMDEAIKGNMEVKTTGSMNQTNQHELDFDIFDIDSVVSNVAELESIEAYKQGWKDALNLLWFGGESQKRE